MVDIPIIDQLVHPSYLLMSHVAVAGNPRGPGSIVLIPPFNLGVAFTYGLKVELNSAAPARGRKIGVVDVMEDRVCQLAVDYTFLGGVVSITEIHEVFAVHDVWFWSQAVPSHLYVLVDPAVTVNLFYLQT